MRPMTPHLEVAFTRGPQLSDPSLADWLAAQTRVVRVPVALQVDELGARSDITIGAVQVSQLDDSRLGVALDDHLRATGPRPGRCHVWLEGTWRADAAALDVTRFVKAVADGEPADFVEVESAP